MAEIIGGNDGPGRPGSVGSGVSLSDQAGGPINYGGTISSGAAPGEHPGYPPTPTDQVHTMSGIETTGGISQGSSGEGAAENAPSQPPAPGNAPDRPTPLSGV